MAVGHHSRDGAIKLEALAAAERECCGFLSWTLSGAGAERVLMVTADPARPDDVVTVAGLFGAA